MKLIALWCLGASALAAGTGVSADDHANADAATKQAVAVSGTGIHRFSTQRVHTRTPTDGGEAITSTDIIELEGDLTGKVLYHPTTAIDFQAQQLVNTGHQVFSGTVLNSQPVLLLDNSFRFVIDLEKGATRGEVHLDTVLAGPDISCDIIVIGTGMLENGDATASYTGTCSLPPGLSD